MLINKEEKKNNKFLLCTSVFSYLINLLFLLFFKFDVLINNLSFKVSYLDVLLEKGISFDDSQVIFPYYFKFAIYLSIFASLFSIFFLFKRKSKESFILIIPLIIPPLLSMILKLEHFINFQHFEFILVHFLFSVITLLLFLTVVGLEHAVKSVFRIITLFCIFILLAMVIYLTIEGLPSIFEIGIFKFLFGTKWSPSNNSFGILTFILSSIFVTLGSVILGGIIGVLTSVFLVEFIPIQLANIIKVFIKLLAGIPSIVYGFFGMLVVVPLVRKVFYGNTTGDCLLTAIIILSIMILPTIINLSEEAIRAVPREYLEGSLALGVSKIKSIFKIVLPEAKEGIMASIFLGIGKSIGETMAVIMVAGNAVNFPNLLKPVRFLTTSMALEFSYASGLHRRALFGIGLVLFIIISIINIVFSRILKK